MLSNVKTLIYIITGEYEGIQDTCEVYATEEEQIKAFEERSGFTWKQYLAGEYEFDSCIKETFYRCFVAELPSHPTKGNQVTLQVDINCLERLLTVEVSRSEAEQAAIILDKAYDTWAEGTADEVQCQCCEEYILSKLTEAGISYTEKEDQNEDGNS